MLMSLTDKRICLCKHYLYYASLMSNASWADGEIVHGVHVINALANLSVHVVQPNAGQIRAKLWLQGLDS